MVNQQLARKKKTNQLATKNITTNTSKNSATSITCNQDTHVKEKLDQQTNLLRKKYYLRASNQN